MKAYWVCVYEKIDNPEKLQEYAAKAKPAVEKFSGTNPRIMLQERSQKIVLGLNPKTCSGSDPTYGKDLRLLIQVKLRYSEVSVPQEHFMDSGYAGLDPKS